MASGAAVTSFRDDLFGRGLLVDTGVPGVCGRSAEFEDTLLRLDRAVVAPGAGDGATLLRFPPIVSRAIFEKTGYLQSCPHLAGTIHAFSGNEDAHRDLLRAVESGADWTGAFSS